MFQELRMWFWNVMELEAGIQNWRISNLGNAVLESEVRFQILGLGRVKCRAAVIMLCWILSWYSCRWIVLLELIPLVDVYNVSMTSVREGRSSYSGWRCGGLPTPKALGPKP